MIYQSEPLVARLCLPRPRMAERLINCSANPYFYQHYADCVFCDVKPGEGPCAGIVALLNACKCDTVMILPVDLIGAPEKLIETLEQEWHDTDKALVLYDEDRSHSPCIRLRRDTLDTCQAYVDNGGRRLLELYTLIEARSVVVPSTWLMDADTPEALAQH